MLPAIALLLLVRWVAERIEPGYGTAAAITLGLGTIVMTFAAEYFSHVVAATLGFGGVRAPVPRARGPGQDRPGRRRGPRWPAWRSASSTRSGSWRRSCSPTPLARPRRLRARPPPTPPAPRSGPPPALAFNWWALGSPLRFAYSHAVAVQGLSGHAVLGLNSSGFFGIDLPRPGAAVDLLVASRGLLTLTPVLVMAVVGAVSLRKRGRARGGSGDRRGRASPTSSTTPATGCPSAAARPGRGS